MRDMDLESKMNALLERSGIPLKVVWVPQADNPKEHARIDLENQLLMIYDEDEDEALRSVFHEVLEYRLRGLLNPYRKIINSLIEAIEQFTYSEKEKVLNQVMNDFMVWKEAGFSPAPTNRKIKEPSESDE